LFGNKSPTKVKGVVTLVPVAFVDKVPMFSALAHISHVPILSNSKRSHHKGISVEVGRSLLHVPYISTRAVPEKDI
jgi:hypothetical protein